MSDKKDKKVIGIRKDVVIGGVPEKLEPIPEIVILTKFMYDNAVAGTLRTFAFAACMSHVDTPNFGIAGDMEYNWTLMHAQLNSLASEYYFNEVLPALTGVYPEDMEYDD